MIELAHNHKTGLPLKNPILVAGGTLGYGEALPSGFDASTLGGTVVGQPLRDAAIHPTSKAESGVGSSLTVRGDLFGPGLFPLMLEYLIQVLALDLPCAVIAAGGIHTVADARIVLDAGATALQFDSALWIEPGIATWIANSLAKDNQLKRD